MHHRESCGFWTQRRRSTDIPQFLNTEQATTIGGIAWESHDISVASQIHQIKEFHALPLHPTSI
jgi:hypothetical protein